MKIGQNAPAQEKLLQMEAIEATVCRKGSIRQYSAYSGSIIAYGGFAWLPRQRKQIRQVTWQPRTWKLERGGCNQATKNMEAGTWIPVPGSSNLEPGSGYLSNHSHPKGGSGGEAERSVAGAAAPGIGPTRLVRAVDAYTEPFCWGRGICSKDKCHSEWYRQVP